MAQSDVAPPSSRAASATASSTAATAGALPAEFRRAGPGAFITSWRNFLAIIIVLAALAYGWKVTQDDFVSLVVNLPKSQRIFTGLLQPDVVERLTETASAQTPLQVGGLGNAQPSVASLPGGGTLT